jgi:hypothetical protein
MSAMQRRGSFGVLLSYGLALAAATGCDVGHTNIFDKPKTSAVEGSAGSAASGAGTAGSGGAPTAPGGPCSSTSDCKEQVCSPEGLCVDCNEDGDCLANQYCDQTHCVATGGDTGGKSGGGTGGTGGTGGAMPMCGGAQLLFAIQRSGIMFEQPHADANYWSMVQEAIVGDEGALRDYASKLLVGALFFVREQDNDTCPVLSSQDPKLDAQMPLSELFGSNLADYQKLADADVKLDAPVGEAMAAATKLLSGSARHVILITTGVADTCTDTDNPCLMDWAIGAVQEAQKAGVTTHVIGLGDTGLLDTQSDQNGYETYLKQLANAGAGKPVKKSSAFNDKCSSANAKATYASDNGDAKAYRAESSADVKSALDEILKDVCP